MNLSSDPRNVTDQYKGMPIEAIVADLDQSAHGLEIAIENVGRDYNMGTIVRSANAFGVRRIHVIGSRQWNKRGAMMTDKYLHMEYHASTEAFLNTIGDIPVIAIDNVPTSQKLSTYAFSDRCVLVFGAEGPGLSQELLAAADAIVAIEQLGSTRSINVGVAAGIAMYGWLRQHIL
jgi:tRNA G18 (ribose-2'-O)-methylase SpoU